MRDDLIFRSVMGQSSLEGALQKATRDPFPTLRNEKPKVKKNYDIVRTVVEKNGMELEFASKELQADREIVKAAVTATDKKERPDGTLRRDGTALQFASDALKADPEIVKAAVTNNGAALEYASDALKADPEIVKAAVTNNGFALEYAFQALKADPEIVKAAVTNNGLALHYASDALKADPEIVIAAVKNDGSALENASEKLKANKDFIITLLRKSSPDDNDEEKSDNTPYNILKLVESNLKTDIDVVNTAREKNGLEPLSLTKIDENNWHLFVY